MMTARRGRVFGLMVAVGAVGLFTGEGASAQGPAVVRVGVEGGVATLTRDGKPYTIRGGGGDGSLKVLVEAGGNSVRTWGVERSQEVLDEAQERGVTVTLGIWLGHRRHGFDYNSADQVAAQQEAVRSAILKYKDHPALLMWGLGNEMEGYEKGDDAAIWSAVNNLAAMAKKLDPNHPTMTVVAEIGGDRVKSIQRLCPEIDVIGINSYGGAASLARRYREAGGVKPFVLTEYGPPGRWESPKTGWGAPIEKTSTEKALAYRSIWRETIAPRGLCLGGYAFVWGHKQEATATWFGLLLPDGSRLAGVDALTEAWTGKPPRVPCPAIDFLMIEGPAEVAPGAVVKARLKLANGENPALKAEWVLRREVGAYSSGGDAEAEPEEFPKAVRSGNLAGAEVVMPASGGGYRLFVVVRDGNGGAATANVPLLVPGPVEKPKARKATLPFSVYDEAAGAGASGYAPSGFMGDTRSIAVASDSAEAPHAGKTCMKVVFSAKTGWGGVVWQHPANDWGDAPGGFDLTGAKTLSFWARGARGGEVVSFAFGILGREKPFPDSSGSKLENVRLTPEWKRYTIDLAGLDLSRIKTGFSWSLASDGQPVTFFLDAIRFE